MRRRVWCETLAFDEVVAQADLLVRYGVDLLLAVRPWQLDEAAEATARLRGAGVFVALWPMIADGDGRWASVISCARYVAFADDLLARVPCDEIAIDLEPPIAELTKLKNLRPTWTAHRGFRDTRDHFARAIERWRPRRATTAVMPFLAAEVGGQWMQRLLGTPVSELPVERHSVMAYTSLFEGWSRGLVGRRRAELLLAGCARMARWRFGARAALSLGTVGTGAFGDEPCYRDPGELAADVAIAMRAGIDEISLFDLGGVVRRAPAEAWLGALVG